MKTPDFEHIIEAIGQKRYKHILRVRDLAKHLAERHGVDVEKAETAALFHDICKYRDEAAIWAEARRLHMKNLERFDAFPQILHAYVAAEVARIDYGIDDEDVLEAIRVHTTGRPGMGKVAEVVFLADYLEPMRNFKGVDRLREAAEADLTQGMQSALSQNLIYLIESNKTICLDTVACFNDYVGRT